MTFPDPTAPTPGSIGPAAPGQAMPGPAAVDPWAPGPGADDHVTPQPGTTTPVYVDPITGVPVPVDPVTGAIRYPETVAAPTYPNPAYPNPAYPNPAYPNQPYSGPAYPPYQYQAYPISGAGAGRNGLAIASMVLSLAGICVGGPITGMIGAILGHVARAQIRRTGEDGAGMALAGIIIGWVLVALFIGIFAVSLLANP